MFTVQHSESRSIQLFQFILPYKIEVTGYRIPNTVVIEVFDRCVGQSVMYPPQHHPGRCSVLFVFTQLLSLVDFTKRFATNTKATHKSRDFYTAKMMSASRIFRMPCVTGSISKRYMSNVEIVNNKIVLAKLRQVPGKKIMYFVSIKSLKCTNIYQIILHR